MNLLGLHQDTSLISLGLVSEDGQELYLEFNDYNKDQCDDWIQQNVIENTIKEGTNDVIGIVLDETNYHYGSKEELKVILAEWLSKFDDIQLVSDVCHYDMVLFINLFGTAFDLPDNITAVCHDINQDIALFYWISDKAAFDFSREDILEDLGINIRGNKHNALYDAKVIKAIHETIKSNWSN